MPFRKKGAPLSQPEKVRLEEAKKARIEAVQAASSVYRNRPLSEFLRYLIEIGANVYEKQIQPIEDGIAPPGAPSPHISGRGTKRRAV